LGILSSVSEKGVEMIASPFNAVLDLIREVSQSAHWDSLFGWILGISIALGLVGNDHLLVCLGSECTGLEEWLLIPDASAVNIKTGLDVIDSVYDEIA